MAKEKITINLRVAGYMMPIEIDPDKEEIYRKAAKLVQARIDRYLAENFQIQDKVLFYSMIMLDFAVLLVSEQNVEERLQSLVDKLDRALLL